MRQPFGPWTQTGALMKRGLFFVIPCHSFNSAQLAIATFFDHVARYCCRRDTEALRRHCTSSNSNLSSVAIIAMYYPIVNGKSRRGKSEHSSRFDSG
jgi:hypothetical protein